MVLPESRAGRSLVSTTADFRRQRRGRHTIGKRRDLVGRRFCPRDRGTALLGLLQVARGRQLKIGRRPSFALRTIHGANAEPVIHPSALASNAFLNQARFKSAGMPAQ